MNLVVATRHEGLLMRFEVEGRWRSGDALKLAYFVKAALDRVRHDRVVLIDLSRVRSAPDAQGKFLICDRLRRALAPGMRVGLVGPAEIVDVDAPPSALPHWADVAVFGAERDARQWLTHS